MEAAAYLAGEPHSDHPECVSSVIGAFLRTWNDGLPDDQRQMLKSWIPKVLHTRTTPADEETRGWMALDWLVRVHAPVWLDLAGLTDDAGRMRNLPALTSREICIAVQPVLDDVRSRAAAAWDAAWDAATDAAWDAAMDAARDAAGAAAWAAAWDAAWAAARDAAGAAVRAAATDAARAAVRAAAWDAAWDAAWAAAGRRLAPAVAQLQQSAFVLLDRMIAVGQPTEPAQEMMKTRTLAHEMMKLSEVKRG
jgi:hypothetical protein